MNPLTRPDCLSRPALPREGLARKLWHLWRQGEGPSLAGFLTGAGDLAPLELVAVLRVDQHERWVAGDKVLAETYLEEHPGLRANPEIALDLIYGEYLLREQLGLAPQAEEFLERFPAIADELRLQIDLHHVVRSDPDLNAAPREDRRTVRAETAADRAADLSRPAIPGYHVLGKLGRGGMGVVYKAWQVGLKRPVALKMIRGSDPSDSQQQARFRAEAEAVARLRHPHIVQIYEVGEHEGHPFFSLEYVDGGSLDQALAGTPQPVRPAARLVQTLAKAIQHAHEQGIIHRDLKPANVLLQIADLSERSAICNLQSAIPKVTDFGLAKRVNGEPRASADEPRALAGGPQTQTGAILGTPSYMAPEQASGRTHAVGPATDVYALGAILYEMICGRPPFQGATVLDTLEQVRSQEPVSPSRLQPKVPRDLDTICLKCLEKDPARRYVSADDLAGDLGRFLAGEPIKARPARVWERTLKWVRRRPAVAALGAALLATVVGLLGQGIWSYVQIHAALDEKDMALAAKEVQRQKAVRAQSAADRHQKEAEKQSRRALQDRDAARKERDQARRFLSIACLAVDRFHTVVGQDALFHLPHMENLRKRFLQGALAYYAQLVKERVDDPELLTEQGRAYMRYAQVTAQVESVSKAGRLAEQGRDLFKRLHRDHPDHAEIGHCLARADCQLADLYCDLARPDEARAAYGRAITLLNKLTAAHPGRPPLQDALASAHHNLGLLLLGRGQAGPAEEALLKALKIKQSLATPKPYVVDRHRSLALTLVELAALYQITRRGQQAEATCRQGLAIYLRLALAHPGNTRYQLDLGRSCITLGNIALAADRPDRARSAFVEARDIFDRLTKAHPSVAEYLKGLAACHNNLGTVYDAAGELAQAEDAYRQASFQFGKLALANPAVTEFTVFLAGSTERLAAVLRGRGKTKEALRRANRAVEITEDIHRKGQASVQARDLLWRVYSGRADSLALLGKHTDALADLDKALRTSPPDVRDNVRLQRAGALARVGQYEQATTEADALARAESPPAAVAYDLACVYAECAEAVLRDAGQAGRAQKAGAYADRAMRLLERARAAKFFQKPANIEHCKHDPDLKGLQGRADFRQFLKRLEQ